MDAVPEGPRCAGVDVAAERRDGQVRPMGVAWAAAKDPSGQAAVAARLAELGVALVVVEASGGYERPLAAELVAVGGRWRGSTRAWCAPSPRRSANWPRPMRWLRRGWPRMARRSGPRGPLAAAAAQAVTALVARRADLVAIQAGEKPRLGRASGAVRPSIAAHLGWLTERVGARDRPIAALIAAHATWHAAATLRLTAPGVGAVPAATLGAAVPDVGQRAHAQIAALVGGAPRNRARGTARGPRTCWGGRAEVRRVRCRPPGTARPHDPGLRALRARLVAAGTRKTVAVVACRPTVLTILTPMLRDRAPWTDPTPYATPVA
jgi:transposase